VDEAKWRGITIAGDFFRMFFIENQAPCMQAKFYAPVYLLFSQVCKLLEEFLHLQSS
jgi:hypothetical protein